MAGRENLSRPLPLLVGAVMMFEGVSFPFSHDPDPPLWRPAVLPLAGLSLASSTEDLEDFAMSRSVDLFIDADVPLEELAGALGRQLGAPLAIEPDQTAWRLRDGEVEAILAEHPYGDDGELLFTRYRFALSARLANDVRPHDTPEAGLLRRIAQKIQQGPAWPVLLVHDLQYRDNPVGAGAVVRPTAGPAAGAEQGNGSGA
jgi:hypothetical protein